jgi:hypothetical protein
VQAGATVLLALPTLVYLSGWILWNLKSMKQTGLVFALAMVSAFPALGSRVDFSFEYIGPISVGGVSYYGPYSFAGYYDTQDIGTFDGGPGSYHEQVVNTTTNLILPNGNIDPFTVPPRLVFFGNTSSNIDVLLLNPPPEDLNPYPLPYLLDTLALYEGVGLIQRGLDLAPNTTFRLTSPDGVLFSGDVEQTSDWPTALGIMVVGLDQGRSTFTLVPAPEPAPWALIASALVGFWVCIKRRI